jgi:hypothetical protein
LGATAHQGAHLIDVVSVYNIPAAEIKLICRGDNNYFIDAGMGGKGFKAVDQDGDIVKKQVLFMGWTSHALTQPGSRDNDSNSVFIMRVTRCGRGLHMGTIKKRPGFHLVVNVEYSA